MLFSSPKEEAPPTAPWEDEPPPSRRPLPLPLRHLLGFTAGGAGILVLGNFLHFLAVADHPAPRGPDPGDLLILGTSMAPLAAGLAGAIYAATIVLLQKNCFRAEPPRRFRAAIGFGIAFGLLMWLWPGPLVFILVPPALALTASFVRIQSFLPYRPEDDPDPPPGAR